MFVLTVAFLLFLPFGLQAQQATSVPQTQTLSPTEARPTLSFAEMEVLLRNAKVIREKWLGTGVTNPRKLTLIDGTMEFHAVFKTIDDRRTGLIAMTDGMQMNFKDSWKFDVAAYELDKLLGLNMVPATVERSYKGKKGAIQWWIEDAMTERDRIKNNIQPLNIEAYNESIFKVRVFDNLVSNSDRNLGNLLYDPAWKVWMIDHSRCFKNINTLQAPELITRFSQSMMESMRKLDENELKKRCGKYLSIYEIQAMLKRRDAILQLYDKLLAEKGDTILYP